MKKLIVTSKGLVLMIAVVYLLLGLLFYSNDLIYSRKTIAICPPVGQISEASSTPEEPLFEKCIQNKITLDREEAAQAFYMILLWPFLIIAQMIAKG